MTDPNYKLLTEALTFNEDLFLEVRLFISLEIQRGLAYLLYVFLAEMQTRHEAEGWFPFIVNA